MCHITWGGVGSMPVSPNDTLGRSKIGKNSVIHFLNGPLLKGVIHFIPKVRQRLIRSILAPSICWLFLTFLPVSDATGSLLTTSVTTGYSSLILTIQQSSLQLANFTTTYAGSLALLGNAILAVAGKII